MNYELRIMRALIIMNYEGMGIKFQSMSPLNS